MDRPKEQPGAETSAAPPETPPAPSVFTKEQVEAAERKGRSDALAEIGRLRASSDVALRTAQAAEVRVKKMLEEQDRAELEGARDDPPRLLALQERQKRRQAEDELARVNQELGLTKEQVKQAEAKEAESNRERLVREASSRLGVDPVRLAKLAKFTDGTPEAIEDLAKDLPQGAAKFPLKPDSGGALGGSTTWEQVRDAYIKNPRDPVVKQRYLQMRAERRGA